MPIDETIIEEVIMENTENVTDNPIDNSINSPDPEITNGDSMVQEEEEMGTDSYVGEEVPETSPDVFPDSLPENETDVIPENPIGEELENEEIIETETGDFYFDGEEISSYSLESVNVYTDLEAFETSTVQVDLYQYTILQRLEFMQYALCIIIALLFLQIFVRYKK